MTASPSIIPDKLISQLKTKYGFTATIEKEIQKAIA